MDRTVDSPGAACDIAVVDKERRYPKKAGKKVACMPVETFGRPGPDLEAMVGHLANLAGVRQQSRGQPPCRWKKTWLLKLSWLVASSVA